jgi:hypothetical protein
MQTDCSNKRNMTVEEIVRLLRPKLEAWQPDDDDDDDDDKDVQTITVSRTAVEEP